jgi:hypothetical protein
MPPEFLSPGSGLSIPPPLAEAIARLSRAQSRRQWMLRARGLGWSLAIGLTLLAVLELARTLLPHLWAAVLGGWAANGHDPVVIDLILSGGLGALVLLFFLLRADLRAPDLMQLARVADREYGLDERLATVLELGAAPASGDAVLLRRALLDDTAARLAGTDFGRLARFGLPRAALGVPVLVIIIGILQIAPPAALDIGGAAGTAEPSSDTRTLAADEQAATVEAISRIVDQLNDQAEVDRDPTLQAVARTLSDVARQLATADPVDRQSLIDQLHDLSANARSGLSQAGNTGGGARQDSTVPDLLDNLMQSIDPSAAAIEPGEQTDRPPPAGIEESRNQIAIADPVNSDELRRENQDEETNNEEQAGGTEVAMRSDPADDQAGAAQTAPVMVGNGQATPRAAAADQEQSGTTNGGAGTSAGAGADAGAGESAMAGVGSMTLNGATNWASLTFNFGGALTLTDTNPDPNGQRIRIEVPPQTQLTDGAVAPPANGNWSHAGETALSRALLGGGQADAVSRYFLPEGVTPPADGADAQ